MKGIQKILFVLMLVMVASMGIQVSTASASTRPSYQTSSFTWDSFKISVTFPETSSYNGITVSNSYESKRANIDMTSAGTYTYTFNGFNYPESLYWITIYYGNNEFSIYNIRLAGIPEGKNIIVNLDFRTYLKGNISYSNFEKWIENLDKAYDNYYALVGKKPDNGNKIKIVASDEEPYALWVYPNTSTIYWHKNYIASDLREINRSGDWNFGMLHEMSHLFDLDDHWTFDSEFFANFKMAYVFYENDGKFKVKIGNNLLTRYSQIVEYYRDGAAESYSKTLGASPMVYHNDGLTYMFLHAIDEFGSWSYVQSAFLIYMMHSTRQIAICPNIGCLYQ